MNHKIPNKFQEYYHIEGSMPYEKQKKKCIFEYNAFKIIWMDLKKVQVVMVRLYRISVSECSGKIIFVLKLDEAHIMKCQKMEKISIYIMNRCLEYSQCRRDTPCCKVQS